MAGKHIWSANLGPDLASETLVLVGESGAYFVATHAQGTFRRVSYIPDWDIGDSYNCLPIAMGNAPEEVRNAAKHNVPPVESDGLAYAINRHILPRTA